MPSVALPRHYVGAASALLLAVLTACGAAENDVGGEAGAAKSSVPASSDTPSVIDPPVPATDNGSRTPEPSRQPGIDLSKLNQWDRELVQQLRRIGIDDARPVEHGFRGSNVGGHDGRTYVSISTTDQDINYDADLVRATSIRGVEVRQMKFWGAAHSLHFTCNGIRYRVQKFEGSEPGRVDLEASTALVERLIASLDCT